MSGLHLPTTLGPLARCAADDQGRYSMNGVQVSDPGDGTFRCAVTDGRHLLVAQGICPERGHLNCPPDVGVIVPAPAWNEAFRKPPKLVAQNGRWSSPKEPETVSFEFTGGPQMHSAKIRVATRDRSFSCDPIDGRFPDWTQIIPKTAPAFTIKVNPTYLANLLTAVSHMLGDESQGVTLAFWKPDVPMAVVAKDAATGLCLDGLLMPLTDSTPVRRYEPQKQTEERAKAEEGQEQEEKDEAEGGSDAS
jgi:hypothetical protein